MLIAMRAGYDPAAARRLSPRQLVAIAKAEAERDRVLIGYHATATRAAQADKRGFEEFLKGLSR